MRTKSDYIAMIIVGLYALLQLTLIVVKLAGADIPWWAILAPIWAPAVIFFLALLILGIFVVTGHIDEDNDPFL